MEREPISYPSPTLASKACWQATGVRKPLPGHCGTAQSENGLHRRNFPQGLAHPIPHAMGRMF